MYPTTLEQLLSLLSATTVENKPKRHIGFIDLGYSVTPSTKKQAIPLPPSSLEVK